ncbi:vacuolar membrane PQ loop repeat protein [Cordyceps fumosorosea ARSEF 2679]|uniref:Vacuolar membrane PQ loop repeat protein n=1 Tax=Cordyceps fumosorosea (strain ARSEF 2679) TaxID=1081104 RepID=A0A162JQ90_CORFA|nr:vacuolar membrane PQ loop repeat protein [Cordyceps fumosorosea ARSEF 2679]OAA72172.1 vacuolar membrane PQ loop repeat protein [Cordyceps fumosorosea ARSEF 2679]
MGFPLTALAGVFAAPHDDGMPLLEAISGIFGSISMASWICLMLPQMVANYKAKSADGISMTFLVVWMLGDITNLLGAFFTHLAPTAIALACYFCVADCVLITQCLYYNNLNRRRAAARAAHHHAHAHANEDSPLLGRRHSASSRRASHSSQTKMPIGDDALDTKPWVQNLVSLVAVYIIGFLGWYISYKAGAWKSDPTPPSDPSEQRTTLEVVGLMLGYASAFFYLAARVPQIIKNYREKSCEGLALLFFLLSLTGNATYGISLVTYSQDKKYLLNAVPWLLGSVGTIFEDSIIFVQFHIYANSARVSNSSV